MYIIEYNESTHKWELTMPEYQTTEYGVSYTNYVRDGAPSLDDAIRMAYIHRATYNNWESMMFVNGNEVLYTKENGEFGRWIHFRDGSTMKVNPRGNEAKNDNVVLLEDQR